MADQWKMDELTTAVLEEAIGPDVESIQAVAENGAADTTHYCYTSHCYTFYEQHKDALWQVAEDAAGEYGGTVWEFIAGLNTYGAEGQDHLVTGLVWYAMETICQRAMDSMPECEACGEYYRETGNDTGYCSDKCYNDDNAEECLFCDNVLSANNTSGYCSEDCENNDKIKLV